MDFRQLKIIKKLLNRVIFRKQQKLKYCAASIKSTIKKLETELGTTLIHRYRQKWKLTESGQ